ncbi:MAG: outer membrane beta-barrel protein [Saprospiraceae bacterium]|nr:outer membrane beta-barrel protein [Saprospiraceae bacterium]
MLARTSIIAALFVAMFATSHTAQAQVRHRLGFTIGSNYSSVSSDMFTTSTGRLSTVVGCNFQFDFNEQFSLTQEIMFTQKGGSARAIHFVPEQISEEHIYNYHYNTFEAGAFATFFPMGLPIGLQGGAFFGTNFHNLNRNSRDLYVGDYVSINHATRAADLNDAFAGMDFGPAVGISAATGRFQANARYYYGVSNLYNNLDFVEAGHRINTNSLRLSLTYFLR